MGGELEDIAAADDADFPAEGVAKKRPASAMTSATLGSVVLKRPAFAKTPSAVGSKVVKRPAAPKKRLLLGCSRCRGSKVGCLQCRSPNYGGRRFQK